MEWKGDCSSLPLSYLYSSCRRSAYHRLDEISHGEAKECPNSQVDRDSQTPLGSQPSAPQREPLLCSKSLRDLRTAFVKNEYLVLIIMISGV